MSLHRFLRPEVRTVDLNGLGCSGHVYYSLCKIYLQDGTQCTMYDRTGKCLKLYFRLLTYSFNEHTVTVHLVLRKYFNN